MGRFLKFLLIGIAAVVGLLVVVVLAVALLFDPNDYKDEISAQVEAATGRSLTLEGDLELGLFPWLSVDTGRIVLGNAEGFGPEPFAELDEASVAIRLWPLITGSIEAGRASVDGLVLNLRIAGDGTTNWDDLAAAGEEPAEAPAAEDERTGLGQLRVAGVSLTGATIDWQDEAVGVHYRVTELGLNTGAIEPGLPFDVDGGFVLATLPEGPGGEFELATVVTADLAGGRIVLDGLLLDGRLDPGAELEAFDFGVSARRLAYATEQQALQLDGGALEVASLRVDAELTGTVGDALQLSGRIEAPRFSPKDLADTLGTPLPPTADPAVLQLVSFAADVALTDDSVALSAMTARLDDTELKGDFSMRGFEAPSYRFALEGDRIDLDRYLAPPADDAPAEADTAALDATEIPVDVIRSLDAEGTLKFAEVVLGGLTFRTIELGVSAGDGRVRLHPIAARVLEGGYNGDVRIDASGSKPRLSVDERVEGVQLAALGRELYETDKLSGSLQGRFTLAGSGANLAEIRQDLGGDVGFELSDGAFEGTDLWYQIRRARAVFRRETPPQPSAEPRTPFSTIRGTGKVADGVLTNDDLFAELPFLRVTGAGTVDLAAATLDYGVRARVLERPDFIAGASEEELDEYTEAVIPIRITGSLADPSVRPDVEDMLRQEVKGRIEEEKERLQKKLLERLGIEPEEEAAPADGENLTPQDEQPAEEEESVEDQLKKKLKDLLGER
ncbi:AsmA family protein [Lentisalinibacter salinarum]|uniref:AsmA family protein n=1 Tax=Lentisalinibacter salinarum TaxID=2992239 RepID=UPI0038632A7B